MILDCPECGGAMTLKGGRFGTFYGCLADGCRGSHGAHPDGRPVGVPADARTKRARISAHDAFDRLWKHGRMSRSQSYAWMSDALGMSPDEAHIGKFDVDSCKRLESAMMSSFPDLFPFLP